MTKEIKITYSQKDIEVLISNDLFSKGYTMKTIDLHIADLSKIPSGTKKGDVISVQVEVKEKNECDEERY
jgi:hypothetical protein